jgi:fructoselysine 6-kinase
MLTLTKAFDKGCDPFGQRKSCWLALFSPGNADDDEVMRVLDVAQSAGVELITVTRGSRGATVCHRGEAPAVPFTTIDTLGAGDAFASRWPAA